MTARPVTRSALILVDPASKRVALGRRDGVLILPQTTPERGDSEAGGPRPGLSRARLGAAESRAAAFQDAALRALYEETGQLIARPALAGERAASHGSWGRIGRHRLLPDRKALTYLGRALDPADAAPRRHVRLFAARLARVSNSLKHQGRVDRMVWLDPAAAADALNDPALAPYFELAVRILITRPRPRPLKVVFRAGHRIVSKL